MRIIPCLFVNINECCGCSACEAVCPKDAIYMAQDQEGFEYPHIDEKLCVGCKLCISVCPMKENS